MSYHKHEDARTIAHSVALHMNQHEWLDLRSLISSKNRSAGESARMMNDKCELYEFSLHTTYKLHTNHELCIMTANTRIV